MRRKDIEFWARVDGYPDYEVSTMGRIRSCKGGVPRIMKGGATKAGHRLVSLCRDGNQKTVSVHRLVMETFQGPPDPGEQCRHLDGDPANNSLWNLAWGTHTENMRDRNWHEIHPLTVRPNWFSSSLPPRSPPPDLRHQWVQFWSKVPAWAGRRIANQHHK